MIASVEMCFAFAFFVWFIKTDGEFKRSCVWKPLATVKSSSSNEIDDGEMNGEDSNSKAEQQEKNIATEKGNKQDMHFTRQQVIEIYKENGLPYRDCHLFLVSKGMSDKNSSTAISYDDIMTALKGKHVTLGMVSTPPDNMCAHIYMLLFYMSMCVFPVFFCMPPPSLSLSH